MNPCHTRWAVPIDSVNPVEPERCELCGNLKHDDSATLSRTHLAASSMWIIRACERVMWGKHRPHGIGSVLLVVCAKILNPQASMSGIAAATGLSRPGVQTAIARASEIMPDIHRALWGK